MRDDALLCFLEKLSELVHKIANLFAETIPFRGPIDASAAQPAPSGALSHADFRDQCATMFFACKPQLGENFPVA